VTGKDWTPEKSKLDASAQQQAAWFVIVGGVRVGRGVSWAAA